jgi:exopolysaccharide biosynthesis polyprenyl glycosylphosphotransferase
MKLQLKPREHRVVLIAGDLAATTIAVLLALGVWALRGGYAYDGGFLLARSLWWPVLLLLWFVPALLSDFHSARVAGNWGRMLLGLVSITALELGGYLLIYFVSPPGRLLARGVVLYHAAFSLALVVVWRAVHSRLVRTALQRRVVVVGAGSAGRAIARVIDQAGLGLDVLGFVDDDPAKRGTTAAGLPVLGTHSDLVSLAEDGDVSQIILAITHDLRPELFRALLDCGERGAEITPMPLLYEELTGRVPVGHVGNSWLVALPLDHASSGGLYPIFKRALDLFVALVGLCILAVFFPFVALATLVDSPGPVFYHQDRVGQGGRVFGLVKLRTMVADAERQGAVWARTRDPRVTRVGRVLRAAHIDELPQFLNVLRGEMSVVGPRPERPEFVAQLEREIPFYRLRHAVRPGMAGWALVNAGYGNSVEDALIKVEYDLFYIKHQSVALDLVILARTLGRMVLLRGSRGKPAVEDEGGAGSVSDGR